MGETCSLPVTDPEQLSQALRHAASGCRALDRAASILYVFIDSKNSLLRLVLRS